MSDTNEPDIKPDIGQRKLFLVLRKQKSTSLYHINLEDGAGKEELLDAFPEYPDANRAFDKLLEKFQDETDSTVLRVQSL